MIEMEDETTSSYENVSHDSMTEIQSIVASKQLSDIKRKSLLNRAYFDVAEDDEYDKFRSTLSSSKFYDKDELDEYFNLMGNSEAETKYGPHIQLILEDATNAASEMTDSSTGRRGSDIELIRNYHLLVCAEDLNVVYKDKEPEVILEPKKKGAKKKKGVVNSVSGKKIDGGEKKKNKLKKKYRKLKNNKYESLLERRKARGSSFETKLSRQKKNELKVRRVEKIENDNTFTSDLSQSKRSTSLLEFPTAKKRVDSDSSSESSQMITMKKECPSLNKSKEKPIKYDLNPNYILEQEVQLRVRYEDNLVFLDTDLIGGTWDALLDYISHRITIETKNLIRVIILTHRTSLSSDDLFDNLAKIFFEADDEFEELVRSHIILIIKTWLEMNVLHFIDLDLLTKVNKFIKILQKSNNEYFVLWAKQILDTWKLAVLNWDAKENLYQETPKIMYSQKIDKLISMKGKPENVDYKKLELLDFHPLEFARQLTIRQQSFYLQITSNDFIEESTGDSGKSKLIHFNNILSLWTGSVIVKEKKDSKRIKLVSFLINICENLKGLQNYTGLLSIYSGLMQYGVQRLSKTWKKIPVNDLKKWTSLQDLLSPEKQFGNLRKLQNQSKPPFIPSIAVFSNVFVQSLEAEQDIIESEFEGQTAYVNLAKLKRLYSLLSNYLTPQRDPYPLAQEIICLQYIRNLDFLDQTEIEELSGAIESSGNIDT